MVKGYIIGFLEHGPYWWWTCFGLASVIRGLNDKRHQSQEYAVVTLYLPGYISDKPALGEITREVHLVDKLSCKVLIDSDIIEPEEIQSNIDVIVQLGSFIVDHIQSQLFQSNSNSLPANRTKVAIYNNSDRAILIPVNTLLGSMSKWDQ